MKRLTILAVDDIEANRLSLEYLVHEYCDGIDVVLASSGEEALKLTYTTQIDLVILDIQMPEMDGFEVAKFLKSNPKTSKIPVIFLTAAFKEEEFKRKGFEIGAIDYLTKPIENHQFINKLKLYKEVIFKTKELEELNKNLYSTLQKEIQLKETIQKQQKELIDQSKMAALGEMIGNIAHQWRQPLSVISTCASGLCLKKDLGMLEEGELESYLEKINHTVNDLSNTIEAFRNSSSNDTISKFNLKELIDETVKSKYFLFEQSNIELELDIEDTVISNFPNSLKQSLVNILINSKEAIDKVENLDNKIIRIYSTQEESGLVKLYIHDNGGGVDQENISKVFDPYFTTKHQAKGVGLGLNVAYNNIENMQGKISVENETITYKDKEYLGAKFTILIKSI